jgi:hypothetical protein
MGAILSATTVQAQAYLTELGRQYLFQENGHPRFVELEDGTKIDRLKIERFSLGDPDINYRLSNQLESGDLPDLSGENAGSITGTKGRVLTSLISPSDAFLGTGNDELEYTQTQDDIVFDLNKDLSKLPTVITQELITLLNGESTLESNYNLFPKIFGKNEVKDEQLVINLSEPTPTTPGYRMKIFYPTLGEENNKITIQFEKAIIATTSKKELDKIQLQVKPIDLGSLRTTLQNSQG